MCALEMLPASSIVPPGCSTDAGSDGAARLSRAGEDALLPWDACSGFNAINECQRSKGPWLGAGGRRVPRAPCGCWLCSRVCMSYSARKQEARGKGCLLCHGRRCSPSTQIFNFWVHSSVKQSRLCLCGRPQRGLVLGLSSLGEGSPTPTEAELLWK